MSRIDEFIDFLESTGQSVFIEAEAKPGRMDGFISQYNRSYSPSISLRSDGIIVLQEDANKWGLELRVYLNSKLGAPSGIRITHNDAYRGDYSYRINDNDLVMELFDKGYVIGQN